MLPKRTNSKVNHNEVKCAFCGLYDLCNLAGLARNDIAQLESVVERRKEYTRGSVLIESGDKFRGIFAVKSGAFKAVKLLDNNEEQIIDFYLPGELIGIDHLNDDHYCHRVVATENSSICEMNLEILKNQKEKLIDFQSSLIHALSRKIKLDQMQSLLISTRSAEQRLAAFLTGISCRLKEHDMPSDQFRIPVARKDIASYLGLAPETVVRILKTFVKKGLIDTQAKNFKLIQPDQLHKLAQPDL